MEERAGERRCIGGGSAPLPDPLPARASRGEGEAGAQVSAYYHGSAAMLPFTGPAPIEARPVAAATSATGVMSMLWTLFPAFCGPIPILAPGNPAFRPKNSPRRGCAVDWDKSLPI